MFGQTLMDSERRNIPVEIIESSPAIVMRVTGGTERWRIVFVTANVSSLGHDPQEWMSGRASFLDFVHPEDRGGLTAAFRESEETGCDRFTANCRLRRGDGHYVWMADANNVIRDDTGRIRHIDSVLTDYALTCERLDLEMEHAMRTCIDDGFRGFEVFYQPLADLDRRIIGAEALLRWTLDGRRLSPGEFIPLAEYLGLIVPLGEYVLERATRCCRAVNEKYPDFFVSVNASMRQFRQAGYLERTLGILSESCVDLRNVFLEITEGMAVHDLQNLRSIGEALRGRGVGISMDDFGTGYSSLGNMRELPLDVVKIDRVFVRDVGTDVYSAAFIRLITDLVHSMGRRVCVEGVETEGQFGFCRECGVDYVQGFYLWRPMPEGELAELLGVG